MLEADTTIATVLAAVAVAVESEAALDRQHQEVSSQTIFGIVIVRHAYLPRDRKSTRPNSSHSGESRMPSSA